MATFERSAVQIDQGVLTLYLTYLTPEDLFPDGFKFYTVDKLEPATHEGYQRILNTRRANQLARHLTEGSPEGYAHIPTTIFLATDKPVDFDRDSGVLHFETNSVCPFSVVDGQHRIEGLRRALRDDDDQLWDFKLPVAIAANLDDTHQMYHFYIVNTTQKSVGNEVQQQITRRFTDMKGIETLPYLPSWLERRVSLGADAKALKLIEFLNENDASPLKGRVRMANDDTRPGSRVNQGALVSIFKEQIFTGTNPINQENDLERQSKIMLNYFKAIDRVFVAGTPPNDTIVWRSSGLFFFSMISRWVFTWIYAHTRDFRVEAIVEVIQNALNELDEEIQDIAHPEWWHRGTSIGASGMNRAAARTRANEFLHALNRSSSVEIQI